MKKYIRFAIILLVVVFITFILCACRPELVRYKHVVYRRFGLLCRLGDNHTLSGRKPVSLDYDRQSIRCKRGLGFCRILEDFGTARRYARRKHDLLRKTLGAFHPGSCGDRAERLYALRFKRVYESEHERRLWAYDYKIRMVVDGPIYNALYIFSLYGKVLGYGRSSGVAGRTIQLVPFRILRKPPRKRMLSTTAANHEYLHNQPPYSAGILIFWPTLRESLLSLFISRIF